MKFLLTILLMLCVGEVQAQSLKQQIATGRATASDSVTQYPSPPNLIHHWTVGFRYEDIWQYLANKNDSDSIVNSNVQAQIIDSTTAIRSYSNTNFEVLSNKVSSTGSPNTTTYFNTIGTTAAINMAVAPLKSNSDSLSTEGYTTHYQTDTAKKAIRGQIPTNTNQLTNGAGFITANQPITLTGDITGTGTTSIATTLVTTSVTPASYGDGTHVGAFTVDSKGRLTAASSVAITGAAPTGSAGGDLTGSYPNPTLVAAGTAGTYGSATQTPVFTTDSKGRVTAVTNTTITPAASSITGTLGTGSGGTGVTTQTSVNGTPIAYGVNNTLPIGVTSIVAGTNVTTAGTTVVTVNVASAAPSGSAGGDLTGTYPNPTLAATAVTAASYGSSTAIPSFTVDAKGRLTAASTNAVIAPAGTLSGTTLNSSVVTSSLTSVGTITTGVWNGTAIANANLANSSVTVNGTAISLGASGTVTAAPSGSAGGSLSGTYPNPSIASSVALAGSPTVSGTASTASGGILTTDGTQTETNKRINPRVGTTTSSATPTINTDNTDIYSLTAQAVDITSFTTNLSGTPVNGQLLEIQITGTATRNITWGTGFESSTYTLPAATVSTAMLSVILQYNSATSKWRCAGSW